MTGAAQSCTESDLSSLFLSLSFASFLQGGDDKRSAEYEKSCLSGNMCGCY